MRLRLSVSAFDEHGDAARAVALVGDLFVDLALQLAGALLDGAVDVVARARCSTAPPATARAQAGVALGVAAAEAGGDGDLVRSLVKSLPRRASVAAFLCLIVLHLL